MNSHEVFIHIHQGCFAGTGTIVRLPQCQWSKPDGYGKISQCITTTKHSKAKTVCIFLGIYCTPRLLRQSLYMVANLMLDSLVWLMTLLFGLLPSLTQLWPGYFSLHYDSHMSVKGFKVTTTWLFVQYFFELTKKTSTVSLSLFEGIHPIKQQSLGNISIRWRRHVCRDVPLEQTWNQTNGKTPM